MRLLDTAKIAKKAISANKVRAALTSLGVVIGVFAVVTLIALGEGIQNYVTDEFDKLGSNLVYVSPGSGDFADDPAKSYTKNLLEEKHIKLIEQYAGENISGAYPVYTIGYAVKYKTNSTYGEVYGTNQEGVGALNYVVNNGREFSRTEERSGDRVAIIGPQISKDLFKTRDPVGQKIKISDESFEVIGVFESKGSNYDKGVIVPYTTVENVFDVENYTIIMVSAKNADVVNIAVKQVELALLRDLDDEEFEVLSQTDILSSVGEILEILTIALSAIAGISLLVGGIGIMNIMLVSVTERTREIGLRKALGATPNEIALQFLVESMLLSTTGGIFGLLFGVIVTISVQSILRAEITPGAVALAMIFSITVGAIFGTYPAINAAKKDPIVALRYE